MTGGPVGGSSGSAGEAGSVGEAGSSAGEASATGCSVSESLNAIRNAGSEASSSGEAGSSAGATGAASNPVGEAAEAGSEARPRVQRVPQPLAPEQDAADHRAQEPTPAASPQPEPPQADSEVPPPRPHPLRPADRASLAAWGATRLGMVVLAWIGGWVFATEPTVPGPWLARWDRWDEGIFVGIARHWYFAPGSDPRHVAFFPGFPVAIWVMHLVVWNWVGAGLAVSAVAGAVAVVALGRLAAQEIAVPQTQAQAAANATLFFALAPAAVFLAAGYSESLFAAFAFTAWASARRDRWALAAVLVAGASAVRVNGLFLAAAVVLEFLLAGRERRRWRQAPLLALPALPVAAYMLYLRRDTGDWLAWQHAQAAGWFRTFQSPRSAWDQTWRAGFGATQAGHTAWVFQLELLAIVVGLGLTALLLLKRRWPEALYVALSLLALGTTTWFMSVPRAMLLWWPLWTMLGAWAAKRPLVRTLYVCCVAPIMAAVALLFLSGQWAG